MIGPPEPPDTDDPSDDLPDWDFSRVSGPRPVRSADEALPWSDADFARISENLPPPPVPAEERLPAWRRFAGAWRVPSLPRPALPRVRLPRLRLPRLHLPRPRLPRPQLSWPALPTFRLPRARLPRVPLPRLRLPRVALPRLSLPRLPVPRLHVDVPRFSWPHLRVPRLRVPRLRVPRLAAFGFPRLQPPRLRMPQPRLPQPPRLRLPRRQSLRLRTPQLQLPRPQLPYPQFPRPSLPHVAWRAPAHNLARRAGGLRVALASQRRRAGADAARAADRAALRAFRAVSLFSEKRNGSKSLFDRVSGFYRVSERRAAPLIQRGHFAGKRYSGAARRGTARGVSALTGPGTGRYWQSGSLASVGLSLGLVAAMSAVSLWRAPGEAPVVNYVEGTPVPAVIRPFSDVELAQLRPVPVPLPRVAYQAPPRRVAAASAPASAIDFDALPARLVLPADLRRPDPLDRAATAEVQVRLLRLGYAPGAPTGRLSRRTQQAIALFQKNAGLSVTGAIDASTIERLRLASAS